jgi:hypothetical protein
MMVTVAKCRGTDVDSAFFFDQYRVPESGYIVGCLDLEPRRFRLVHPNIPKLSCCGDIPRLCIDVKGSHCETAD